MPHDAPLPSVPGLDVEVVDGVAVLALDRPHRRNALDRTMLDHLAAVVADLDARDDVRALVLTGRGGAFCAGGDLEEIGSFGAEDEATARARMRREFSASVRLAGFGGPTVAAVEGAAVGAGLALALACDVRVGAPSLVLASPFARMALVPDFGLSWLLTRTVGADRAVELLLTGRRVRADEAARLGLVHEVVEDPLTVAVERARALAAVPAATVRATRDLVAASSAGSLADLVEAEIDAQVAALAAPAFAEAVAAWTATVRSSG